MKSLRRVIARAPSNIAWVKYMGKLDSSRNLPANPSLSMTLNQLGTIVELREVGHEGESLKWSDSLPTGIQPGQGYEVPRLSPPARQKFLLHRARFLQLAPELFERLGLRYWNSTGSVEIRSANSFPHSSGIASSASSLAALTTALFLFHSEDPEKAKGLLKESSVLAELASVSRLGSGSSCRSFFGPFTAWDGERVYSVESSLPPLVDLVCLISTHEKKVSSSEAHARVRTSPLWNGRPSRTLDRFQAVQKALVLGHWSELSRLVFEEAMEMHELFHTSSEPFTYLTEETNRLLSFLRSRVGDRALITLDAGPNVHVLVPVSDREEILGLIRGFSSGLRILSDVTSPGPEVMEVIP